MNIEVWYHANCLDGFGAAYAAWLKFGNKAVYRAVQYGSPPPDVEHIDYLYIVDFSYKYETMMELSQKHGTIVILDHHKTAQEELEGKDFPDNVRVLFDMERSGALITWEFFNAEPPIPDLIRYIQDRDLWTWDLSGTKEITAALASYSKDFETWDRLFNTSVEKLFEEGQSINRYVAQQMATIIKAWKRNPSYIHFDGVDGPIINAPPFFASEILNELGKGHPFAASFIFITDSVIFSLRSNQDGVDVSEIARKRGGGGHKHAAGFGIRGDKWFSDEIRNGLTLNGV